MAVLKPGMDQPGRSTSLRGAAVFYTHRGVLVCQKWPRPRGKPKTQEHRDQVEWFRQAQGVAKRVDAKTQVTISEAFAGSPLMPRDVATSLMAGRMYSVALGPHKWIRSKRAMSEVSNSLDVISTTPGDTLVRAADAWVGAPLSAVAPLWINPAPQLFWTAAIPSGNYPWRGNAFTATAPIAISAIAAIVTLVAGATYQAALWTLSAANEIEAIQLSEPQAPGRNGQEFVPFPLTTAIAAGQRIAIVVGRTDAGPSLALPIRFATNVHFSLPATAQSTVQIATDAPAVGQTPVVSTAGVISVFPRAAF